MTAVQESSVEKFGAVHAKVQEGDNEQETTRGASLRELQRFFKEHDEDKGYAGLRRIADEDGTAVWTLLNETEVAAQLERRARERHEEEQRHEKIFSNQARAPSEAANAVDTPSEAAGGLDYQSTIVRKNEKAAEPKVARPAKAEAAEEEAKQANAEAARAEERAASRHALIAVSDHSTACVMCSLQ